MVHGVPIGRAAALSASLAAYAARAASSSAGMSIHAQSKRQTDVTCTSRTRRSAARTVSSTVYEWSPVRANTRKGPSQRGSILS